MALEADIPDPSPGRVRVAPGITIPASVLDFTFVSSSGPGGQNVNKRATKCLLRVRVDDLPLGPAQRSRLEHLAGSQLTDAGELLITADEHRSQGRNKAECLERLSDLVRHALVAPKVRRPTKPSRGARERRLTDKKHRSAIKERRRGND